MNEREELNEKKLNAMKIRILMLERENLKTQERTNDQMADKIRGIITEEANKSF